MLALLPLLLQSATTPPMPDLPACTFDRPARLVTRKADLPADARAELDRLFQASAGIAEANAFFESTDSITTNAPHHRFLRAYRIDDAWLIWFESGGIVLSRAMLALRPLRGDDGRIGLHADPGSHFSGDLCASSRAYLMGARSAG